jgi:hypothetical protein
MKLVLAGGSLQMQRALIHRYVRTIALILFQYIDQSELLRTVAGILQTYDRRAQAGLETDLEYLLVNQSRPGDTGLTPPSHVVELIQTLHNLYQQRDEEIRYQRGAILEVLVYLLVCPRYNADECRSNHRFVDNHERYVTEQVDVAALSQVKHLVEGYECKLKASGIESSDCTNLAHLDEVAVEEGYHTNVGFVTFDDEKPIKRKITRLYSSPVLNAYGLDSLELLRNNPF